MRRRAIPWMFLGAMGASLALATCSSGENGTSSTGCPQGICGPNGGNGGSGAGSTSATASGSATGSTSAGSSTSSGAGCVESWSCTPWATDGTSDAATRTCTDLNACGTTATKPIESATLPALDVDYYQCKVEPIFDRGCAHLGCHGTETGRGFRVYARGRLRITGDMLIKKAGTCGNAQDVMVPSESCTGSIECACFRAPHTPNEWRRNYDVARSFALDTSGNPIPAGMVDTSELIAQPIVGGKAHAGVHLFASGDADHQTLKSWLTGAKLGSACVTDN